MTTDKRRQRTIRARLLRLLAAPLAAWLSCLAPPVLAEGATITAAGKTAILAGPVVPFAGNPAAKVTIVEYFDVNCPYCKAMAPVLQTLIATRRDVRILYKDWPIFGGVSLYAARVCLAANWQGRYLAAHDALMAAGPRLASEAQVRDRLGLAGIDLKRLDRDLSAHAPQISAALQRDGAEAQALAFRGTPGLVIGETVVPGGVVLAQINRLLGPAT